MSAAPVIIIVVPVEGTPTACIVSSTYEEQLRVAFEVWDNSVLLRVAIAIEQLRRALIEREQAA